MNAMIACDRARIERAFADITKFGFFGQKKNRRATKNNIPFITACYRLVMELYACSVQDAPPYAAGA